MALLFDDAAGAVAVVFGGKGGADGRSVEIPAAARRLLPETLLPRRAVALPAGLEPPADWEVWPRARRVDFFCDGTIPAADTAAGTTVGLALAAVSAGAATFYRATGLIEAVLPGERRRIVLLVREGTRLPTRDTATVRAILPYSASRIARELAQLEGCCDTWEGASAGPGPLAVAPADARGYAEAAMLAAALRELLEGVDETLLDAHQDIGVQTWKARSRAIDGRLIALMERVQRDLLYRVDEGHRYFRLYYPADFAAVAPTAIGNVLRAVDSYTDNLYGLDAALVLQRLLLVLSAERRKTLSDFRERLDFLQWSWLGAIVVGGVGGGLAFAGGQEWLAVLVVLLAFPIAWWLLYPAALSAAVAYADQLRVLFDSERGAVLAALGLLPTGPVTQAAERDLWGKLGQWWEYGAAPDRYTLKGSEGAEQQ